MLVNVTGTFINASLKKTTFEGKNSFSVQLDVYQPTSPSKDKLIQIKVDDTDLLDTFNNQFSMGDPISIDCSISAYKNQAYFKLVDVIQTA